jgi:hypothetical protein
MYVGGGIAPKLLKKMQDGTFMKAFTDKGRLSDSAGANAGAPHFGKPSCFDGRRRLC